MLLCTVCAAVGLAIAFLLVHMSGDPAAAMAGEGASASDIEAVRELFGFDRPLYTLAHYGVFMGPLGDYLRKAGVIEASRENAADHLRSFSGGVMTLHSAAALARDGQILWVGSDFARLHVRELSDAFIEIYLDAEWPAVSQCVGVFRIEGPGAQLFDGIMGDQFTVLGMPLLQVLDALREEGALLS